LSACYAANKLNRQAVPCTLKPYDLLRSNDDGVLRKLRLKASSEVVPISLIKLIGHDFDHGNVVSFFTVTRIPDALARRAKIARRATNRSVSSLRSASNHERLTSLPSPVDRGTRICTRFAVFIGIFSEWAVLQNARKHFGLPGINAERKPNMATKSPEDQFAEEQARFAISQQYLARDDNPDLDPMRQEELDRNRIPGALRDVQLSPNSETRSREAEADEAALLNGGSIPSELAHSIKDRPYTALALAAVLGFVVGAIWKS